MCGPFAGRQPQPFRKSLRLIFDAAASRSPWQQVGQARSKNRIRAIEMLNSQQTLEDHQSTHNPSRSGAQRKETHHAF